VSQWSSWSACSLTCGGGVQSQTRSVTVQARYGGAACPALSRRQSCATHACPVNCQVSGWSSWSACSVKCGGGTQKQSRTVIIAAAHGGIACPRLSQSQACNTHACPINCVVSPWTSWSKCTATCGGGTQQASRTVVTTPAFGGKACQALTRSRQCNTHACPFWTVGAWGACSSQCGGGIQTRKVSCSDGNADNCAKANTGTFASFTSHFIGCFADSGNRDLRNLLGERDDMTVIKCHELAQAAGYRYFAVQDANQCFADNRYGTLGKANN